MRMRAHMRWLVILAQEDGRCGEDPGEVQGLVEVPFGGGPVPEERDGHLVGPAVASGVREANGVGDLGRHREADRQVDIRFLSGRRARRRRRLEHECRRTTRPKSPVGGVYAPMFAWLPGPQF
jgi:hypothetical protein